MKTKIASLSKNEDFKSLLTGKKITNSKGEFVSVGIVKGKAKETVSEDKLINYVELEIYKEYKYL